MRKVSVNEHYDLLIQENNDPVKDPPVLQNYMNKWDGQSFIDALALNPDSNVLEIGIGTGRLAKRVLETGCGDFTGIDISSVTIERAKENLSEWVNISLIQGEFIGYQFQQAFDIVYCSLTLFHFKDKKAFIQKVAGLLNAEGKFVLSIPKKKEHAITFIDREVELYPDDLNTIEFLLTEVGFTKLNVIDVEFAQILVSKKT